MSSSRYHSRVFDALNRVYDDLLGITWTAHPTGGSRPTVSMLTKSPDIASREWVEVALLVDDDEIAWRAMPTRREERFSIQVRITTSVPGVWGDAVLDRLEVLADQVQGLYLNTTTGVFTPPAFDGVTELGGIAATSVVAVPTDEGIEGSCTLTIAVVARI